MCLKRWLHQPFTTWKGLKESVKSRRKRKTHSKSGIKDLLKVQITMMNFFKLSKALELYVRIETTMRQRYFGILPSFPVEFPHTNLVISLQHSYTCDSTRFFTTISEKASVLSPLYKEICFAKLNKTPFNEIRWSEYLQRWKMLTYSL